MTVDTRFAEEFICRLDRVRGLRSTRNNKFDEFEIWFANRSERSVSVSYVNGLQKQFTARMGAALLATPDVIVLLSTESWTRPTSTGRSYAQRLEDVVRYVRGLHAVVACVGEEGRWSVEFVVGPDESSLRQRLAEVFSRARDLPVR